MRKPFSLLLVLLSLGSTAFAQSGAVPSSATKSVQQAPASAAESTLKTDGSPQSADSAARQSQRREIKLPGGTPLEIEAASTVDSFQVRSGELLSFRVLVPIKIDGEVVIDKDALVTARVLVARRGGHWGRAGRLSWIMRDVIAVDGTRIPVQAEDIATNAPKSANVGGAAGQSKNANSVKGDSHSGEIAARTAAMGALLIPALPVAPILAPLILMHGFKRGENAVLPEHKRFVVFISNDASVRVIPAH
jgi:hypothetical protein